MRTDQFMGLNDWARELLKGCGKTHFTGRYETRDVVAVEGEEESKIEAPVFEPCVLQEKSGLSYCGMFDNEYALSRYILRDGRVYYEYVQAEPWDSGPMFFVALRDEEGQPVPESLWSEEEIANA